MSSETSASGVDRLSPRRVSDANADPTVVINERESTHGSYPTMAGVQAALVGACEKSPNWDHLPAPVKVFVLAACLKLARVLCGDPLEPDHYDDVGGYAKLTGDYVRSQRGRTTS